MVSTTIRRTLGWRTAKGGGRASCSPFVRTACTTGMKATRRAPANGRLARPKTTAAGKSNNSPTPATALVSVMKVE